MLSTLRAFATRDLLITRSYRFALLSDLVSAITGLLLYFFISRTFEGATPESLGGSPSYFAFAAVGAAVTAVIHSALAATAVGIRQEQLTGTLEAITSQPVSPAGLAIGMTALPFVTAPLRAGIYLVLADVLLGLDLAGANLGGALAVLVASTLALSGLGIASAAMVIVVKRGDIIAGFASFAIGLLSGAFFPISVLPNWVEPFAKALPTRFAFDGLRAALFGGEWVDDTLILLAVAAVLLPLSLLAFGAALAFAKRAGSIAEY
ncbi:MAG: ABC transporter permease [Egibacteraceae bacterium]